MEWAWGVERWCGNSILSIFLGLGRKLSNGGLTSRIMAFHPWYVFQGPESDGCLCFRVVMTSLIWMLSLVSVEHSRFRSGVPYSVDALSLSFRHYGFQKCMR